MHEFTSGCRLDLSCSIFSFGCRLDSSCPIFSFGCRLDLSCSIFSFGCRLDSSCSIFSFGCSVVSSSFDLHSWLTFHKLLTFLIVVFIIYKTHCKYKRVYEHDFCELGPDQKRKYLQDSAQLPFMNLEV